MNGEAFYAVIDGQFTDVAVGHCDGCGAAYLTTDLQDEDRNRLPRSPRLTGQPDPSSGRPPVDLPVRVRRVAGRLPFTRRVYDLEYASGERFRIARAAAVRRLQVGTEDIPGLWIGDALELLDHADRSTS